MLTFRFNKEWSSFHLYKNFASPIADAAKVSDVVKEGDEVSVKVIGFDRGKVKLSIKEAS